MPELPKFTSESLNAQSYIPKAKLFIYIKEIALQSGTGASRPVYSHLHKLSSDFEVRSRISILKRLAPALLDAQEEMVHCPGHDAHLVCDLGSCPAQQGLVEASAHCIGLARASLEERDGIWLDLFFKTESSH